MIDTLAFLAVYAASGESIRWSAFFTANFERWQYIRDHFVDGLSLGPALVVAVFAGLAVCVFSAMIRAPFFRAVAGVSYPLAPRGWKEAGMLSLFYLLWNLVVWVLPMATPIDNYLGQLVPAVTWVVGILVVFADYVIVYEERSLPSAIRQSLRLLRHSWPTVLVIFMVIQLVYFGIYSLYDLYYSSASNVFVLFPISQMLVEAFVALIADLLLIYLYEDARRRGPA